MGILYKMAVFLLFAGIAMASGFGSSVRIDSVKVQENGTAEFYMLFWSESDEVIKIEVVEKPPGWNIIVDGEVNVSDGKEMVYSGDNYIKAAGVRLTAETTPGAGNYNIIVSAKSVPKTGVVALSHERIFNLRVQTGEPVIVEEEPPEEITDSPEKDNTDYIYAVIFAAVLFISAAIYKYS